MSLQVWMPLTKDLRQNGLSSTTVTNSGATYSATGGKLGGCYSIPSGSFLYNTDFSIGNKFSVALWIKPTSIAGGTNSYFVTLNTSSSSDEQFMLGCYSSSGGTGVWRFNLAGDAGTITTGVWYHYCCTYDGTKATMYLNGQQINQFNHTLPSTTAKHLVINGRASNSAGTTVVGSNVSAYYNDVRIYDHCMSSMEVRQLSQGLALHYKLDCNGFGNENLAHNTYNLSPWSTSQVEFKAYNVGVLDVSNGEQITISFDLDMTVNTGGSGYLQVYNTNYPGPHQIAAFNALSNRTLVVGEDLHERISYTTTMATRSSYSYNYDTIEFYSNYSTENEIQISNIKIERGSKTTPWCPNPSDTIISSIGINYTTECDCSGFGNNGERIGTIVWKSDTPRYNCSTYISTTSSKIHITNFPTSGFGDSYSFAWWGKRSSNSPMFWGFSNGVRLNGMYAGTLWNTGDSSNNPIYNPGTTTTITAPSLNVWHHYVMTGDGTSCKLYLDGVLYGQAKTYKSISGSDIYINGWSSSTDYCSNDTYMSDFRIYATALSADDVKALYQNSGYVDNKGNVYGFLYEE